MDKRGRKREGSWLEVIFALIVGFLIVVSIPELKVYFDQLVGFIFGVIILSIIVAGIIFAVWLILERKLGSSF